MKYAAAALVTIGLVAAWLVQHLNWLDWCLVVVCLLVLLQLTRKL